jgi:hypothetical protein
VPDLPIRDEIATRVLVALISSPAQLDALLQNSRIAGEPPRVSASRLAYAYADSMLAARDARPEVSPIRQR